MAGRKTTTGEKRTEKLTLYLSPDMLSDIQDLSNLHGESTALYIVDLISKDINSRQDELKSFQDLRKKIATKNHDN